MRAIWNNEVIAESDKTIVVENNHYFPESSVRKDALVLSTMHTTCPWKGVASYYSILAGGKQNTDAAWFYPNPKPAADKIRNYIAFWKGVQIKE